MLDRRRRRSGRQRRAADPLEQRDRIRVSEQLAPDGLLRDPLLEETAPRQSTKGPSVELCPHRRRHPVVQRLSKQGMSELGAPFAGVDGQARGPQGLETALGLTVVEARHLGGQGRAEALAEDTGYLE